MHLTNHSKTAFTPRISAPFYHFNVTISYSTTLSPWSPRQDLLTDTSYTFGTLAGSITDFDLASSATEPMRKINLLARHVYNNGLMTNIDEALTAVNETKFALLLDSFTLHYYAYKYCWRVTGQYKPQEYGILLKGKVNYADIFSRLVSELKANRKIDNLTQKQVPKRSLSRELGCLRNFRDIDRVSVTFVHKLATWPFLL
ncbi:unnamed protein product [Protopolystoma xenopodis]|uniref:Uncharacterized protein n=1 Tax=Protopolystoma xenopodis TaxID=117903 RepID=A0A448XJ69_9PLAT|nr:unnamed protein product [Protopolystoma xenopodis]